MADTTSLSSFPNKIDTFERISDLSIQQGTFEKAKTYKNFIDDKNYSGAEQYLKSNPDLARCAVNASLFNKHSDALTALENESLREEILITTGTTTSSPIGVSAYTVSCDWCEKYIVNKNYTFKFHESCNANATININNLGVIPIKYNNQNVEYRTIRKNNILTMQYQYCEDGYFFNIIGQLNDNWTLEVPDVNDPDVWITTKGLHTPSSIGFHGTGGARVKRTSKSTIVIDAPYDTSPTLDKRKIGTFCGNDLWQIVYRIQNINYNDLTQSKDEQVYLLDISSLTAKHIIDVSGVVTAKNNGDVEFVKSPINYPIASMVSWDDNGLNPYQNIKINLGKIAYPSFSILVVLKYLK